MGSADMEAGCGPSETLSLSWGCQVPVPFAQGQPSRVSIRNLRKWRMYEARKGVKPVVYKGTPQNPRGAWRCIRKHAGQRRSLRRARLPATLPPEHPPSSLSPTAAPLRMPWLWGETLAFENNRSGPLSTVREAVSCDENSRKPLSGLPFLLFVLEVPMKRQKWQS